MTKQLSAGIYMMGEGKPSNEGALSKATSFFLFKGGQTPGQACAANVLGWRKGVLCALAHGGRVGMCRLLNGPVPSVARLECFIFPSQLSRCKLAQCRKAALSHSVCTRYRRLRFAKQLPFLQASLPGYRRYGKCLFQWPWLFWLFFLLCAFLRLQSCVNRRPRGKDSKEHNSKVRAVGKGIAFQVCR